MSDLTPADISAIAALADEPRVARAWADYQAAKTARAEGSVAGGPRHAELAERAARDLWVTTLHTVRRERGL